MKLSLTPVAMTPDVMTDLETRSLIIRLCPNHHVLPAGPNETLVESIYESDPKYGPHKLITVTVNKTVLDTFGAHTDNEEFMLIGDPTTKPLYLIVSLLMKDELNRKIAEQKLGPADFICLRVKYNDPEVSFFTMLANVPHGEAVGEGQGKPPSFYVTEPRDLGSEHTDFKGYQLAVTFA